MSDIVKKYSIRMIELDLEEMINTARMHYDAIEDNVYSHSIHGTFSPHKHHPSK